MFVINVKGNIISVQETEPITSGSVNVYLCRFAFDDSWEGFFRSAVFRVGAMVRTVPLDAEDMCELPWELLVKNHIGLPVEVSVYGSKDETEILPTIWDKLGRVRSGSEPGEDAKEPTPTVYNQLTNLVRIYSEKVTEESEAAAKSAQDAGISAQTAVAAVSGINASVSAAAASAASAKESESRTVQIAANAAVSARSAGAFAASAEEWSRKAEQAAGGGVLSFNGRNGEVMPESGDYTAEMVGADASGSAASALTSAKAYTDTKIAAIPAPDVSGQIATHNSSSSAHSDIRGAIPTKPADIGAVQEVATYITANNNPDFDLDTATDSLLLIPRSMSKNCPIPTTNIFIRQMFYSRVTSAASRTQVAYPYAQSDGSIGESSIAIRSNRNGTGWSGWKLLATTDYVDGLTPEDIDAAAAEHTHSASDITGVLSVANGGTGGTTAAAARTSLGAAPTIQYGTSDVTAGGASSYAEGTLYVVVE